MSLEQDGSKNIANKERKLAVEYLMWNEQLSCEDLRHNRRMSSFRQASAFAISEEVQLPPSEESFYTLESLFPRSRTFFGRMEDAKDRQIN